MDWAAIARTQSGIVGREQLMAAGVSWTTVTRMTHRGELDPIAPAVFLVRGAPLAYRSRLWAAVISTGGVLGFATAAELWGVVEDRAERVHVVVPHRRRLYPPAWVRLHRVPVTANATTVRDGLPTTARSWTVLDHVGTLPIGEARRLADRAIQRSWLQPVDVERRLREYPKRYGNGVLRRLSTQLGDGAAAQSERVLHRLLRAAGIRDWAANYSVWSAGELVGVVDVAIPHLRVAIEVDGWAYHSDVDRFRRDRAKQNDLMMLGWTVLRFTWSDLADRPGYVVSAIRRLAA